MNTHHQLDPLNAACARHGIDGTTLTVEGAFALGRVVAAQEAQEAATGIEPAWSRIDPIACEAVSDLSASVGGEGQKAARRSLRDIANDPPTGLTYDEHRARMLAHRRAMDDTDELLSEARKSLLWLELAHGDFAENAPDGWCDDAREGLTFILRMVGERLEAADVDWRGTYNRDGR